MDLDRLRDSPVGQLVPISGADGRGLGHYDYFAFLAHPLPSQIELTSSAWSRVVEAETSLARLDQAARQIPDPLLLTQPTLRREAQSTSALEGTFAPLEDVLVSETGDRARFPVELREVMNYVAAAEGAFAWIAERHLTLGAICELQRTLVTGTPGELSDAGSLRDRQVYVGGERAPIVDARFVPAPPGDQLRAGMEDWLRWVNTPAADVSPVVQTAVAHYQFETLHPFSDGNGRIGRLLIVLQLMQLGILAQPMLVISPWFEARRQEYQDALLTMSQSGDWNRWVTFFATGVRDSARSMRDRITELLAWQKLTIEAVREKRITGTAERIAGELIGNPILAAPHAARRYGVSQQAAINALRRLRDAGILDEHKGTRRGMTVYFVAPRVLELIRN